MIRTACAPFAAAGALALAGCGSAAPAEQGVPPAPVSDSVYVDGRAVSLSPSALGAGPVNFLIANQATRTLSVTVARSGPRSPRIAGSRPIGAGFTGTLTVDLKPGSYLVATAISGGTDAQLAGGDPIAAATLHVGAARASGDSALLTP
ncbi:MAG: hypothetical protein ACLP22_00525 [Solirubrobacteraceae bacterium]